jgi:hypothetical protein
MVSFLKVFLIGSSCEGFSNQSLKFGGDDVARDMQLNAIIGKVRYDWAMGGVHGLIVACLFIRINIQLSF